MRNIHGLELRYALVLLVHDAGRACTLSELIEAIEGEGVFVHGRPSKTVADAIRWEVAKGPGHPGGARSVRTRDDASLDRVVPPPPA